MRPILLLAAGVLGGAMPALSRAAVPRFSDSVVVSASLDAEARDEVPATVTVVDGQEIEARQDHTLADVIAAVPGLFVARAGAPGQQTSVFSRGANSNQTLLLWNGIPLNDPYFGDINWQFVPADGVARVEVARGPFSALYGSGAVGGVVQVFSGARQGGSFSMEGGDRGYVRGGLAAGADFGNTRLDVTGHVRRDDGRLGNDFFDSEELMARALWTARPGLELGLLARANDSATGVPFSSGLPTPRSRISWQEREVALPVRAESGPWTVDAQLAETRFGAGFRNPDDPFGFTASDTRSQALRGRAVVTWSPARAAAGTPGGAPQPAAWREAGPGLRLALGGEAERLEVTSSSSFGTALKGARQSTWAAFGEASYGAGPLHLVAGLRRDDNDVYGGQTSLRAGVVVRLARGTRLRASYGDSFRAPSLGELFFPGSGNPALRPETGNSIELGVDQEIGVWRFAVTGFENRQRNLIDFDNVAFRDVNIGRARSRGIEGEMEIRRGLLRVRLNGTLLDAKDQVRGLALLRRPRTSANLLATWRPGAWTLSGVARCVGVRADVDPSTFARRNNPGYLRIDLAARRRILPWLSPYARVENVADRKYTEVLGYPTPGRTVLGGLAVDF